MDLPSLHLQSCSHLSLGVAASHFTLCDLDLDPMTFTYTRTWSVLPNMYVACLFRSSLLRVGDCFVHQQSPLLLVPRQPWTLCHCSVWPVLDVICPSSPRSASSSLSIESSFQYFGAQVASSDHMAEVLELASLYSCQQEFMWLYFLQHWCIGPMCRPSYPQQS